MSDLDLTDPYVRRMADRNHQPQERWTLGGDATVMCETCGKLWPCPTRQALDALCTCPDVDAHRAGELPGSRTVKGIDAHCPQHRKERA